MRTMQCRGFGAATRTVAAGSLNPAPPRPLTPLCTRTGMDATAASPSDSESSSELMSAANLTLVGRPRATALRPRGGGSPPAPPPAPTPALAPLPATTLKRAPGPPLRVPTLAARSACWGHGGMRSDESSARGHHHTSSLQPTIFAEMCSSASRVFCTLDNQWAVATAPTYT